MDNNELLIAMQDIFDKKVEEVKLHTEDMFDRKVEEVKRYTGVLVEDLRGEIKAVAEGYSILDRKIDTLQKDLTETKQELKQEIHGLKKDMAIVKDYVIGVDEKLNEHEIILKRVK